MNATKIYKLVLLFMISLVVPVKAQLNFTVNFAAGGGPQLIKDKFSVYQTPLAASSRLNANMSKLSEANIKHLRYEIGWAKNESLNAPQITGTASNPVYSWGEFDSFINGLNANGVTPLYAMTYNPKPLQNNPNDYNQWQSVPNNMGAWQRICKDYATHFKAMGQMPIYEIWNEPDLNGIFFTGNVNDYVNIYINAVNGIRAAEPTAWVGGPAVSGPNLGWFKSFLNGIGGTPITFLSGHIYNSNYGQLINTMRQALNETGRAGLPIYITEYSSFNNLNAGEINSTGIASKSQGASRFFRDVKNLLTYTDVQKVYFAQWIDPEVRDCPTCAWHGGWDNMGMIDLSNQRKALYNAFKLYGWMPVNRKSVSPELQASVGAMASSDNDNATVVLWNEGGSQQTINTTFNNLPFSTGKMEIYRIDTGNASKYDGASENLSILSTTNITSNSASLNTTIAGNGVVFVKMYRSANSQSPYAGVITLPGTVEAENYDNGGEGIAYHDTEAANLGGEGRSEGVDTQTSTEGTYNIGWTSTGEWTEYTVNVAATGSYTLAARMSSPAGGSFHIEMDGTNVSGTVAVPNTGGWQNWQTVTKTMNLTAGQHIMRFYIDQHVQGFNVNKFVFTTASTNGDGLTAQYFNGQNFNTSVLTRKDASINFDWANGSPAAGINSDDFSARWTGQIKPRYTGTYTFYLNTDNGRRLWINNQLIIDKWINDWGVEYTGTIALNANQLYDIKVEYFEAVGGANAKMEWSSSSQAREVVPQSQLYSLASARIASDPEVSPATEASSLQFSPNPANHTVKIVWQNADKEPVTLSVENMQGQSMHREVFKGKTSYELNVAGWPQGLYLIQLQTGNAVVTKKLMVTH